MRAHLLRQRGQVLLELAALWCCMAVAASLHPAGRQRRNLGDSSEGTEGANPGAVGLFQGRLGLRVLQLAPRTKTYLRKRQAIQVLFSRAVIPLGSDFPALCTGSDAKEPAPAEGGAPVAFSVSPLIPGKFRWVTTSLFRFDPDVDWPTDLDITVTLNRELAAPDGSRLELGSSTAAGAGRADKAGDVGTDAPNPSVYKFQTPSLRIHVNYITSPTGEALQLGGSSGSVDDSGAFQLFPDSRLTLGFTAPVNVDLIRDNLKVLGLPAGKALTLLVKAAQSCPPDDPSEPKLVRCVEAQLTPMLSEAESSAVDAASGESDACAWPRVVRMMEGATGLAECAVDARHRAALAGLSGVRDPVGQPLAASLALPAGARYHPLAGALRKEQAVKVVGLKARELTPSFSTDALRETALSFLLPQGLAGNASALRPYISIHVGWGPHLEADATKPAKLLGVTGLRTGAGMLHLSAPLLPATRYEVNLAFPAAGSNGASGVRDAFGFPVLPSRLRVTTGGTSIYADQVVSGAPGLNLALLDASAPPGPWSGLPWPVVVQPTIADLDSDAAASRDAALASTNPVWEVSRLAVLASVSGIPTPSGLDVPVPNLSVAEEGFQSLYQAKPAWTLPPVPGDLPPGFCLLDSANDTGLGLPAPSGASAAHPGALPVWAPRVADLDLTPALQDSGLGVVKLWRARGSAGESGVEKWELAARAFVGRTEVSVLAFLESGAKGATGLGVWVTRLNDSAPVPGASVRLGRTCIWGEAQYKETGPATTDEQGLAQVPLFTEEGVKCGCVGVCGWSHEAYVVVTHARLSDRAPGKSVVPLKLPDPAMVFQGEGVEKQAPGRATLVLDRHLVRPGETLHVHGYVRSLCGAKGNQLCAFREAGTLQIAVTLQEAQAQSEVQEQRQFVPLMLDPKFGSFSANYTVPASSGPGTVSLDLAHRADWDETLTTSLVSASARVALPRPPTASLSILPGAGSAKAGTVLEVKVQARTYLGGAVPGQAVTVKWHLECGPSWQAPGAGGGSHPWPRGRFPVSRPFFNRRGGVGGFFPGSRFASSSIASSSLDESEGEGSATCDVAVQEAGNVGGSASLEVNRRCRKGLRKLATEDDGLVVLQFDLGKELGMWEQGESAGSWTAGDEVATTAALAWTLRVEASAVGPTGEPLSAASTVSVGPTLSALSFRLSTDDPVPGQPFTVLPVAGPLPMPQGVGGCPTGPSPGPQLALYSAEPAAPTWDLSLLPAGHTVHLTLSRVVWDAQGNWSLKTTGECSPSRDGAGAEGTAEGGPGVCPFELPAVGRYVLTGCVEDDRGDRACARVRLGRREDGWEACPLASLGVPSLVADKERYQPGETAVLRFRNPYGRGRALLQWGMQGMRRTLMLTLNGTAVEAVPVRIGAECATGSAVQCPVLLVVMASRVGLGLASRVPGASLALPRSAWADLDGPVGMKLRTSLLVEDSARAALNLSLRVGKDRYEPGEEVEVVVQASDPQTGAPVEAEVLLVVVDKAILDLSPSDSAPKAVGEDLWPALYPLSPVAQLSYESMVCLAGLQHSVDATVNSSRDDPWAALLGRLSWEPSASPTASTCGRQGWDDSGAQDMGGAATSGSRNRPLRGVGGFALKSLGRANVQAFAMAANVRTAGAESAVADMARMGTARVGEGRAGEGAVPTSPGEPKVSLRKDMVGTAYFARHTTDAKAGTVTVRFRLPDTVSTFVVRGYAASAPLASPPEDELQAASTFGSAEASLVSARKLSLVPAVPRMVRLGDTFEAGVVVNLAGAGGAGATGAGVEGQKVQVEVRSEGAVEALDGARVEVKVDAAGMGRAVFSLSAAALGGSNLTFSASAPGYHAADGVVVPLRVEPTQDPVVVATSLAISLGSGGSAEVSEAMELPSSTSNGSIPVGSLNVTAGVGHLPAVTSLSSGVLRFSSWELEHPWPMKLVLAQLPAALLGQYYSAGEAHGGVASLWGALEGLFGGDKAPVVAESERVGTWALGALRQFQVAAYGKCLTSSALPLHSGTESLDLSLNYWGMLIASEAASLGSSSLRPLLGPESPCSQYLAAVVEFFSSLPAAEGAAGAYPGVALPGRGLRAKVSGAMVQGLDPDQGVGASGNAAEPEAVTQQQAVAGAAASGVGPGAAGRAGGLAGGSFFARSSSGSRGAVVAAGTGGSGSSSLAVQRKRYDAAFRWSPPELYGKWPEDGVKCTSVKECVTGHWDAWVHGGSSGSSGLWGGLSLENLALTRVALGFPAKPEFGACSSMDLLEHYLDRLSVRGQVLVALAHLRALEKGQQQGASASAVRRVLALQLDQARIQGRTAYIAAAEGSAASAGDEANALALLLWAEVLASKAIPSPPESLAVVAEKLAAHVAGAGQGAAASASRLFWARSDRASVLGALALAKYDLARHSTVPELELRAASGDVEVLGPTKLGPGADGGRGGGGGVLSVSMPWSALPREPQPLRFSARGKGEVSVAITLEFVPAHVMRFPVYRGLYVERRISVMSAGVDSDIRGPNTAAVYSGDRVQVTLQITSADELSNVRLLDLPPGGLEPVAAQDPEAAGRDWGRGWGGGGGGSGGVFPFSLMRRGYFSWRSAPEPWVTPSRVQFFLPMVYPGTTTVTYTAVAVTEGHFVLPPTKAWVEAQPELMGLSGGGEFWVLAKGQVVPAAAGDASQRMLLSTPLRCPADCSGSGMCNVATGRCECDTGFQGVDCSSSVTASSASAIPGTASSSAGAGGQKKSSIYDAPIDAPSVVLAVVAVLLPAILVLSMACRQTLRGVMGRLSSLGARAQGYTHPSEGNDKGWDENQLAVLGRYVPKT